MDFTVISTTMPTKRVTPVSLITFTGEIVLPTLSESYNLEYIWFVFMRLAIFDSFLGLDKKLPVSAKTVFLHGFRII